MSRSIILVFLSLLLASLGCQVYIDDPQPWNDDDDDDDDGDDDDVTDDDAAADDDDDVDGDGDGWTVAQGDCDDTRPDVYPGAAEQCNGIDDDCDGSLGEDEMDDDGDGFLACEECDDTDANVNPAMAELCNGFDDDCDGTVDEPDAEDAPTWYEDADGDTFGNPQSTTNACDQPSGYVADDTDCDDGDAGISPAEYEIPDDGINQDCDDWTDEIFVCWDGTGGYELISEAVDAAPDGATIEICPGEYEDTVELYDREVSLFGSTGNAEDVTIDASSFSAGVFTNYYANASDYLRDWTLDGLTVIGGYDTAICLVSSAHVLLQNLRVVDTIIEYQDNMRLALVNLSVSSLEMTNCLVANNDTSPMNLENIHLLKIYPGGGPVDISRCAIVDNGASVGGWYRVLTTYNTNKEVHIHNNIIAGNSVHGNDYGLVRLERDTADVLVNNTIVGNTTQTGATIVFDNNDSTGSSIGFGMRNNLICDNISDATIAETGDCVGNPGAAGCVDPEMEFNWFCSYTGSWTLDASNNEGALTLSSGDVPPYSLQPGSPAVDTGDPDAAYDDADGTRNDVGAYGGPDGDWNPMEY